MFQSTNIRFIVLFIALLLLPYLSSAQEALTSAYFGL